MDMMVDETTVMKTVKTQHDELDDGLRCYVVTNKVLSPIQKGVQAFHAGIELFVDYDDYRGESEYDTLMTWARDNKTAIFLEGGFHQQMLDDYEFMEEICNELHIPYTCFEEVEETMNEMFTSFAAVLDYTIYNADKILDPEVLYQYTMEEWADKQPELALHLFFKKFPLAR